MAKPPEGVSFEKTFEEALQFVFADRLARRTLVTLHKAGRAVQPEELRWAVGKPSEEEFNATLRRLSQHLLVVRNLDPKSGTGESDPCISEMGERVAKVCVAASENILKEEEVPLKVREAVSRVFLGEDP